MFHVSSFKTKFKFQQIGMFMFHFQSESADLSDSNIVLSISLFSLTLFTKTTDMKLLPKDLFNFVLSSLLYFPFPSWLH